jgi:hypothetical protein
MKPEARNPKFETNSKTEIPSAGNQTCQTAVVDLEFWILVI